MSLRRGSAQLDPMQNMQMNMQAMETAMKDGLDPLQPAIEELRIEVQRLGNGLRGRRGATSTVELDVQRPLASCAPLTCSASSGDSSSAACNRRDEKRSTAQKAAAWLVQHGSADGKQSDTASADATDRPSNASADDRDDDGMDALKAIRQQVAMLSSSWSNAALDVPGVEDRRPSKNMGEDALFFGDGDGVSPCSVAPSTQVRAAAAPVGPEMRSARARLAAAQAAKWSQETRPERSTADVVQMNDSAQASDLMPVLHVIRKQNTTQAAFNSTQEERMSNESKLVQARLRGIEEQGRVMIERLAAIEARLEGHVPSAGGSQAPAFSAVHGGGGTKAATGQCGSSVPKKDTQWYEDLSDPYSEPVSTQPLSTKSREEDGAFGSPKAARRRRDNSSMKSPSRRRAPAQPDEPDPPVSTSPKAASPAAAQYFATPAVAQLHSCHPCPRPTPTCAPAAASRSADVFGAQHRFLEASPGLACRSQDARSRANSDDAVDV